MPSLIGGHVAINSQNYVVAGETYRKELQTAFNPRFSTGDPSLGDLSFFQYLAMEDFSGGNGQEIFAVQNRFMDSEGVDVLTPGELKLSPKIEKLSNINGPRHEHLDQPVEEEDAWPQITEWIGAAFIYNDSIDRDVGGLEFLEIFETDIVKDRVLRRDDSGRQGEVTETDKAKIINIPKVFGTPGDTVSITVKFKDIELDLLKHEYHRYIRRAYVRGNGGPIDTNVEDSLRFKLEFAQEGFALHSTKYLSQEIIKFNSHDLFTFSQGVPSSAPPFQQIGSRFTIDKEFDITFTFQVPDVSPGIYQFKTSCGWIGSPFEAVNERGEDINREGVGLATYQDVDPASVASFLFFVESIDEVLVDRKNLYAPQLKATAVLGDNLVGIRVVDGLGKLEMYREQNDAIDRVLQVDLTAAGTTPAAPTYAELIGSNGVVIAALDNRIYKFDVLTDGLSDAQRTTFIGEVPGDYVSGMAIWNQRVYVGSVDKSSFTSHITWTNETAIQGSYAIDGKFWIRDMANYLGGLFYCGGTQDKVGEVRAYPSIEIISIEHDWLDSSIRSLNAGRRLYAGWSHGTGLLAITERGASAWARIDLGEDSTNVVWDVEEIGDKVLFLADSTLYRTTSQFIQAGFLETSKIGANTPLIDKNWNSITIETDILPPGTKVKVLVTSAQSSGEQWTVAGELVAGDDIQKTFILPADLLGNWAKVRLELFTGDPNVTPVVKKVLMKYVPSALTKLQWGMSLRADNNIIMLDGTREQRDARRISDDLLDLRRTPQFKFVDIDGSVYDVVLSDVREISPIIKKESLESVVTIEILEI